jgi:prepilin-type N-terminal cleavage/methylation domain-containing protein
MTMTTHRRAVRGGFTLIELLVVIAIIAILVSLISSALFSAFFRTTEFRAESEMNQMAASMASVESAFQIGGKVRCPSRIWLDESMQYDPVNSPPPVSPWPSGDPNLVKLAQDSKSFLRSAFPQMRFNLGPSGYVDWNGDGTAGNSSVILEGEQCLVFWLSGIPSPPQANGLSKGLGFSNNPSNPATAGGPRLGPWYEFKTNRLVRGANGYLSYTDPYSTNQVYAYFSSFNGQNGYNRYTISSANNTILSDCASLGVFPYQDGTGNYQKPDGFQIICAGKDGKFGGLGSTWTPATASKIYPFGNPGNDDRSNFYDTTLGVSH